MAEGSLAKEKQDSDTLEFGNRVLVPRGYRDGGFWFDESVSGSVPFLARPAAATLWRCLKKGDCIVVPKLDRAFRRCADALNFTEICQQRGLDLHILNISLDTSTPMGKFILTVMAGIAEMERENTSIRNKEDIAARKASGLPVNKSAPPGWKVVRAGPGSRFLPCPETRKVADLASYIYGEVHSITKVVESLFQDFKIVNPKTKKPYSRRGVWLMIRASRAGFPPPKGVKSDVQ